MSCHCPEEAYDMLGETSASLPTTRRHPDSREVMNSSRGSLRGHLLRLTHLVVLLIFCDLSTIFSDLTAFCVFKCFHYLLQVSWKYNFGWFFALTKTNQQLTNFKYYWTLTNFRITSWWSSVKIYKQISLFSILYHCFNLITEIFILFLWRVTIQFILFLWRVIIQLIWTLRGRCIELFWICFKSYSIFWRQISSNIFIYLR